MMPRQSMGWTLSAASLALVVAFAVLPAAATQEEGGQEAAIQEQELEARIKAHIEELMAKLEERMARLQEELEAMQENRFLLRELEVPELEELELAQEKMQEALERSMAEREHHLQEALERAHQAQWHALEAPRIAVGRFGPLRWAFASGPFGDRILELAEELELSDTQVQQIRDLQREYRRATIERKADIEVAEMDLEELRKADTPDLAAIRAKLEEVSNLEIDAEMAKMRLEQDVRQVLTPEQRAKLEEMEAEHKLSGIGIAYRRR